MTGRPYRVNLAVTTWSGKDQLTLWHTLDDAPRPIAHKGLMQRREQMVGDAVSVSDDAMRWNRLHQGEDPLRSERLGPWIEGRLMVHDERADQHVRPRLD